MRKQQHSTSQVRNYYGSSLQCRQRLGGWVKTAVVLAIVGVCGVAVVAGANLIPGNTANSDANEPVKTVVRGELLITVVEDGNLESASNIDVKCQVAGGSSILWIVPDGDYVEEGQKIVELDSSSLEDSINSQRNVFEKARATKIQAEQDLEVAKISVNEYLEGTYLKDLQDHDKNITIAQENLRGAESALEHAQMMFRKGYVSSNELDAQKFAVERANLELASSETAKRVLEKFTKTKTLEELESQRDIAEARNNSEEASFKLEEGRLKRLEDQLQNCIIIAPQAGMVVYANERGGRGGGQTVQVEEGASVRERQTLIRIPDLGQMQVKVNVHESKVEELKPGMLASILIQGQKYKGQVESIANQPEPTSWFQGNVKEYATIVKIEGDAQGLKPGMTSEVTILVGHLKDVLYLPLACVVESQGRYFVWANKNGKAERIEVQVGLSNESFVEINGGVEEGDEVFENPSKFEKSFVNADDAGIVSDASSDFGDTSRGTQNLDGPARGGRGGPGAGGPGAGGPGAGGPGAGGPGAGGPGAGGPGAGGPGAGGQFDPAAIFDRMDADKDGMLVGDEISDRMKDRVDEMDTDKDGAISKDEFKEAMKQFSR